MRLLYKQFIISSVLFFILMIPNIANAWNYEISGGIGGGPQLNAQPDYNNIGGIVDFVFLNKTIDCKLNFLLDTSAAYWYADSNPGNSTFVGAISPVFRAYFVNPTTSHYRPFLQVAAGPAFTSSTTLGTETQGSHFLFQDRLGGGIEIGSQLRALMISLQYIHCSNAGLAHPNPGFNFPFVGSIGYDF